MAKDIVAFALLLASKSKLYEHMNMVRHVCGHIVRIPRLYHNIITIEFCVNILYRAPLTNLRQQTFLFFLFSFFFSFVV